MRICDKCIHDKVCLLPKSRASCELFDEYRPHGEWKKIGTTVMCSVCEHGWGKGHAPKDLKDYNFCPNCGADMRKSGEEE